MSCDLKKPLLHHSSASQEHEKIANHESSSAVCRKNRNPNAPSSACFNCDPKLTLKIKNLLWKIKLHSFRIYKLFSVDFLKVLAFLASAVLFFVILSILLASRHGSKYGVFLPIDQPYSNIDKCIDSSPCDENHVHPDKLEELGSLDNLLHEYDSNRTLTRHKRQVPCEQGEELDEYVDSLFKFLSRVIRAMEPISLPNATVELPEYNIKLFLYKGGARRAYKLVRKKSAWVYCSNESISLGLTVGFNELMVGYKYRAIFDWSLLFDGELEARVEDTKVQIQLTQTTPDDDSEEEVQQRVDRIRIWRLGRIKVILKGLGNLTQAISMILTKALNNNQDQLDATLRRVEAEALVRINEGLKNITVPFFSIV